jgi:RNA polymerase sigma-70 factor (ECF subfamily)
LSRYLFEALAQEPRTQAGGDNAGAELEAQLRRVVASARRAWPQVDLPTDVYIAYLGERLRSSDDPLRDLARLHTSDLYLAGALSRRDPTALACFERQVLGKVSDYVAPMRGGEALATEVKQLIRTRLLLPDSSGRVGIAGYRGTGALGAWMRLVAVRAARELRRRTRREMSLPSGFADLGSMDPELAYLKNRYASEVAQALGAIMKLLPPRDRGMLNYYYADRLTTDAIARLYGVDGSTIRRQLARTRTRILRDTHRLLSERLHLRRSEVASLIALVRSQLEVSLSRRA